MVVSRIEKEFSDLSRTLNRAITVVEDRKTEDGLIRWKATVKGPRGSPYFPCPYTVNITFPATYPQKPPILKFSPKIFHPSIVNGRIGLKDLKEEVWNPSMTVSRLLNRLYSILQNPISDEAEILSEPIRRVYLEQRRHFKEMASQHQYREGESPPSLRRIIPKSPLPPPPPSSFETPAKFERGR